MRMGSGSGGLVSLDGDGAECKQLAWQATFQPRIRPVDQETWGSCKSNHDLPKTRGAVGACITRN